MHFLNYFYFKTLKFDLINKFYYSNLKKLPKLKKIVLNFNCKTTNIKTLATNLLALELITNQKGVLTNSKYSNFTLTVNQGNITGCKLTLKKAHMLIFVSKNLNEIFPKIKNFEGIFMNKKMQKTKFEFFVKDTLHFSNISEHYQLFSKLLCLSLSFFTNVSTNNEKLFFFQSLQLPLKI